MLYINVDLKSGLEKNVGLANTLYTVSVPTCLISAAIVVTLP